MLRASPAKIPLLSRSEPYYRRDLALVHHLGYGFHADACAPGILALLKPIRNRQGLVLELGCGTGALTRHLVEGGHKVLATDASPAMLELARKSVPGVAEIRLLTLPDDPLPPADAIVFVGHALSYLPDERAIEAALTSTATALRPGGVLALDLLDLQHGADLEPGAARGRVGNDWAVVTKLSRPARSLFLREITTFVRTEDGSWRRDDETHENVLVDAARIPSLLARHEIEAHVLPSFGDEELPPGVVAIVGRGESR